jgi:speckle-type POZ protein
MSGYSNAGAGGAAHPNMIVQYEWILENVDKDPKTFVSKMILFRGEKVFRVGLKNYMQRPILFFMAIHLSKIGMEVKEVAYVIQDSGIGPTTMAKVVNINSYQNVGSLQLFTTELAEKINGNCTFVFRICIEGSASGYSYRLSDRLAKDQLWAAAAKSKNETDVEFVVKGKTFSAHKAILAARSKVFEAEFTKEQPVRDGPHQIHIDGVEPSTVEQFLHFIYTGESKGTLANEELLKLAEQYQLITLSRLCRLALNQITHRQMANLVINLDKETGTLSSVIR